MSQDLSLLLLLHSVVLIGKVLKIVNNHVLIGKVVNSCVLIGTEIEVISNIV